MSEKELVTREEVDQAIKDAEEVRRYAHEKYWISTERKMENIIRVIVKLAER